MPVPSPQHTSEATPGGVDAKRLTTKGFGQDEPVADNTTDEGRFKNRRIDLKNFARKHRAVSAVVVGNGHRVGEPQRARVGRDVSAVTRRSTLASCRALPALCSRHDDA